MVMLRADRHIRDLLAMLHTLGHRAPELKLNESRWSCPGCGARMWKDKNGRFVLHEAHQFCRTVEPTDRDEYWRQDYVSGFVATQPGA